MGHSRSIAGKRILIVDDERDILETLIELLNVCKVDTVQSFEEAGSLLERNEYDVVILDIMSVKGFDLLRISAKKNLPTIMLTAHALSAENLKKSAQNGASYYVPKEAIDDIAVFVYDVLESKEKNLNPWVKCIARLGSIYDKKFGGPDWRLKERAFWEKKLGSLPRI
jgi:DNA-binding NtrC family response regulator